MNQRTEDRTQRHFDAMRRARLKRGVGFGLRLQVLLTLALLLMVTVLLIGTVVFNVGEDNLLRQKAASGMLAATMLSQAITASLGEDQPLDAPGLQAHLQRVVEFNAQQRQLDAIALFDVNMERIAAASPDTPPINAGVEHAFVLGEDRPWWTLEPRRAGAESRTLLVLAPVRNTQARPVGVLGLRMSMAEVDRRIQVGQRLMLLYLLIDALALVVVGYFLLTRLIVRPIEAIGRATRRVAQGDYTSTLTMAPHNEIGQLAGDFNIMMHQLKQQREALEQRVNELSAANEALARTQQSLIRSEKLATVGKLAAGVAHEIGNPLSAVIGYTELLADGGIGPEEDADLIRRIDRELHRIDATVRDLLDYSRADNAGVTHVSVPELLKDSLDLVQAQPRFRDITLKLQLPEALPLALANEGRLQQVLVNLLLNASDAMNGRGVITMGAHHDDATISISIEDNGPGIPGEVLPQIFEPFFTTKATGRGTGLGLAICQSIIEGFQGDIHAENLHESGARFTLRLPMVKD